MRISRFVITLSLAFIYLLVLVPSASSQVPAPDSDFLFKDDKLYKPSKPRKLIDRERRIKPSTAGSSSKAPFNIDAPNLRYDKALNAMFAEGGLKITRGSGVFEADEGVLDLGTNKARLEGDVYLSDQDTTILAESAHIDINEFTGELDQCGVNFADSSYLIESQKASKLDEDDFRFDIASITTCDCPQDEGCLPWYVQASEVNVREEGYADVWHSKLYVQDIPVLYIPYFFFPAKRERASGFLAPTFGGGSEDGFALKIPYFWDVSESTDLTFSPIIQTNTRAGAEVEFRKVFSRTNEFNLLTKIVNESWRDGDLRGTIIDGLDDPTIDETRFGINLDNNLKFDIGKQNFQVILDGNYVSDDLFLRELETLEIAPFNTRYVRSNGIIRTNIADTLDAELRTEFTQAMIADDDVVLQRLPQFSIGGVHRFKPFGTSPHGLKLIWSNENEIVNFSRKEGYDGLRADTNHKFTVPFHFGTYFTSQMSAGVRATAYNLDSREIPNDDPDVEPELLKSSSDRVVPSFEYDISTVVERVYEVDADSTFKRLTELGTFGRTKSLTRLKHTIEPEINYYFVPSVNQDDNPQFDSVDHLDERNVVTYGVTHRLYGRFDDRNAHRYGIEEATPEVSDVGSLTSNKPLSDTFGYAEQKGGVVGSRAIRRSKVKELATLYLGQSFDIVEDKDNVDPDRSGLRDLNVELTLLLNDYVKLRADTDFDVENTDFSAYSIDSAFETKRGDSLRTGFRFVDERVRQLESGLEIKLTEKTKLGYYSRYDDLEGEFIENKIGIRVASDCNCWVFDVEASDKINPDKKDLSVRITLVGLGEIGNNFWSESETNKN